MFIFIGTFFDWFPYTIFFRTFKEEYFSTGFPNSITRISHRNPSNNNARRNFDRIFWENIIVDPMHPQNFHGNSHRELVGSFVQVRRVVYCTRGIEATQQLISSKHVSSRYRLDQVNIQLLRRVFSNGDPAGI